MGVWIETIEMLIPLKITIVTPCVGVWIETYVFDTTTKVVESHPAWVCGLKHIKLALYFRTLQVTPCVGVWIETPRT